ncbi:molybdenum ABC transporter ATP-binding protein [Pseudooceanicola sp. 216_PA32_1]|uniref:Molybdenum ABC transporter ATP-binding protein n=1 Tax=Pseudooceanicola pacificus TaxID=2676438 RepID=A0A844W270_9RHOB|nr:molybdenum ABC transporter ATP-binding protein [Pseudooceanicola pacificus]MWB76784.1 molybdenum ABC transporter ATP-binding protein [Pseudooceanicola pacificus]
MSLSVAIRHSFGNVTVDAAFDAPEGVTALFGRSGAGKTTVANAVAGLLRPQSGRIVLQGRVLLDSGRGVNLPPHHRRIGYVFQEGRLFPHLSVRGNLAYPGRFAGRRPPAAEFDRVVGMLGIGDLLDRQPQRLSGGEKQRVAIGRALLSAPEALLMDEPLAALDAARKEEILPYLEALRDEARIPILYVSHAMDEVARLATTLVLMSGGRVLRAGPAAELLADPELAPMIGLRDAGALLSGRLTRHHPDGLSEVAVSGGPLFLPHVAADPGTALRIRIEAQDIILSRNRPEGLSALNILPATVTAVHSGEGPGVMIQLRTGDEMLLARLTRRSAEALALVPGTPCHAVVKSVAVARGNVGRAKND